MNDPLPKHHRVYLVLREQLEDGRFIDGLPGELALTREFGVARVTVRRALERLAAEGRIVRARGRGTAPIVRPGARPRAAVAGAGRAFGGLLENIVDMGLATSVKVVSCRTIAAPPPVADALGIAAGSAVQKAVRVRSTREGPVAHVTTWVPQALAAGFGRRELARQPILLLLEAAGVCIGDASQTVSARLADANVAPLLDVSVGSALLAVNRVVHDAGGHPVQWLHGLYRPDRYEYRMQLSSVGAVDAQVWVSRELPAPMH